MRFIALFLSLVLASAQVPIPEHFGAADSVVIANYHPDHFSVNSQTFNFSNTNGTFSYTEYFPSYNFPSSSITSDMNLYFFDTASVKVDNTVLQRSSVRFDNVYCVKSDGSLQNVGRTYLYTAEDYGGISPSTGVFTGSFGLYYSTTASSPLAEIYPLYLSREDALSLGSAVPSFSSHIVNGVFTPAAKTFSIYNSLALDFAPAVSSDYSYIYFSIISPYTLSFTTDGNSSAQPSISFDSWINFGSFHVDLESHMQWLGSKAYVYYDAYIPVFELSTPVYFFSRVILDDVTHISSMSIESDPNSTVYALAYKTPIDYLGGGSASSASAGALNSATSGMGTVIQQADAFESQANSFGKSYTDNINYQDNISILGTVASQSVMVGSMFSTFWQAMGVFRYVVSFGFALMLISIVIGLWGYHRDVQDYNNRQSAIEENRKKAAEARAPMYQYYRDLQNKRKRGR